MANILDFKKPELSKTEKAIEVMEQQMIGLQRQIASICLLKGIKPNDFAISNQSDEVITFLRDTSAAHELLINAKKAENNKEIADKFKFNEQAEAKESIK